MTGAPASRTTDDLVTIAGFQAAWTRLDLDVAIERDGAAKALACAPLELYTLHDPERAIDTAALLREPVIEDPPYWAIPWTGARAIAAVVANRPFESAARVLDLGCGLGLSGLAAARRGVSVTFGDYLDEPLAFVHATLERLAITSCDVRRVDFTRREADDGAFYDLILAADIVYDPSHYEPLASYLDRHLATGGTILLTESLRADARVFLEGMTSRAYADKKTALWVIEDGRRERTWLHELTRRERDARADR